MRRLLVSSILLLCSLGSADLGRPNFTGDWKLDLAKSDFGQLPQPSDYERKIDHKDPLIQMTVRQVAAGGEQTLDSILRTDGQEITNKYKSGEAKTVGKWVGRDLQLTTTRAVEGGDVVSTDTWSLSADGKTLTTVTQLKTPRGSFQVRMVLEKQ